MIFRKGKKERDGYSEFVDRIDDPVVDGSGGFQASRNLRDEQDLRDEQNIRDDRQQYAEDLKERREGSSASANQNGQRYRRMENAGMDEDVARNFEDMTDVPDYDGEFDESFPDLDLWTEMDYEMDSEMGMEAAVSEEENDSGKKQPRKKKAKDKKQKEKQPGGKKPEEKKLKEKQSKGVERNSRSQDRMSGTIPQEELDARDQARLARQKKRKKELRRMRFTIVLLIILILAGGCTAGYFVLESQGVDIVGTIKGNTLVENVIHKIQSIGGKKDAGTDGSGEQAGSGEPSQGETQPDSAQQESIAQSEALQSESIAQSEAEAAVQAANAVIAEADRKAAQYDYDGAVELLKSQTGYDTNTALQEKVAGYEASKAACVEVSPDTVSHVFVHSLIVDPARAFDGDNGQDGYNLNMVTVDEFRKIIQSMYDNGYVIVSLHDMGEIGSDGTMQRKSILLPEGKKPVVFSQDDVSYYHTYTNDGFATKLVVDENGQVKNEYTDAEGNTSIGDYDMIPILDAFIEEHPDFSYHGRKGIIALTGYNGVLGYHTDADYRDKVSLQEDQRKWLEENPDFNIDTDIAEAKKVADAMKANGWEFASHTWGHISVSDKSLDELKTDTQKWLDNVAPIVGDTDMIIFAFGSDIGDWTGYSADNEKFNYLKSVGFDYFCNVDGSTLSWVQFGNTYLRQGRMNVDGYRMATNPDVLSPLFNVSEVYDTSRPEMPSWTQ
ncbi:MAG: polysaccharide deacetylase [Lachnospiraceae bacterium]|nr:polysaccharide deacetylase [Lachnospiraceae bacterium]